MAIVQNVNLFALYADLVTMSDPRETDPSATLMTITAGELTDFADAVRAQERCLTEGGDEEEAWETARAHYNDSRL
ncbi:hypothetical protein KBY91_15370 [Streptomyces sp. RK23]|uniref:hypothetical protein n=1 Tax=unclassified Streptomyces TaxID=2593676 RepID=UPI001B382CFF|nr:MULTISPECIES: hypothetical protein [unclassified Streptomyces]MBQ0969208.1 hypothetical protein [Streptomyces sp. RK74B]MBQ1004789.1 hypothetical protein [Streptomyces sp. RK23]